MNQGGPDIPGVGKRPADLEAVDICDRDQDERGLNPGLAVTGAILHFE